MGDFGVGLALGTNKDPNFHPLIYTNSRRDIRVVVERIDDKGKAINADLVWATRGEGWYINGDGIGKQTRPAFECDPGAIGLCMAEEVLWSVSFAVSVGVGLELFPVNVVYGNGLSYTFFQDKIEDMSYMARN